MLHRFRSVPSRRTVLFVSHDPFTLLLLISGADEQANRGHKDLIVRTGAVRFFGRQRREGDSLR